jgi:hypothetical protein
MSDDWYAPMFGDSVAPWHRWFAWRPVSTVDRGTQWLRVVYRRRIQKHSYLNGGPDFWFQHVCDVRGTGR